MLANGQEKKNLQWLVCGCAKHLQIRILSPISIVKYGTKPDQHIFNEEAWARSSALHRRWSGLAFAPPFDVLKRLLDILLLAYSFKNTRVNILTSTSTLLWGKQIQFVYKSNMWTTYLFDTLPSCFCKKLSLPLSASWPKASKNLRFSVRVMPNIA